MEVKFEIVKVLYQKLRTLVYLITNSLLAQEIMRLLTEFLKIKQVQKGIKFILITLSAYVIATLSKRLMIYKY